MPCVTPGGQRLETVSFHECLEQLVSLMDYDKQRGEQRERRGRGIYRGLVAHPSNLAADRGFRYLEVDASDDSRPILERLGFVPVTTTPPFIWSPS